MSGVPERKGAPMVQRMRIHAFGSIQDPLCRLEASGIDQASYLRDYLANLECQTVLEEPTYFDRDYLAEFAAFYCTSSRGYANRCRRLHFFARPGLSRADLKRALRGSPRAARSIQDSYLGFSVIRPLDATPLGRTVLRWYVDLTPNTTPRVTDPSRIYRVHLAGLELTVHGLAWQQQDTAVGACATVALWTMLHSSAFDDHHAIPATAEITRYAHTTASLGSRIFPSDGLNVYQVLEAIKETGLAPVFLAPKAPADGFSRERFSAGCAVLLRSGYPVLLGGELEVALPTGQYERRGHHALACVGFREAAPPNPLPSRVVLQDAMIRYVYLHNDNIGPGVRSEVEDGPDGIVRLRASAPQRLFPAVATGDPTAGYPLFRPTSIIAATHEDLRLSPDALHTFADRVAQDLRHYFNKLLGHIDPAHQDVGVCISAQFLKLHKYQGSELARGLRGNPRVLAAVRLALAEKVPPMSLHVGVVRIGLGAEPKVDILCDTTDSEVAVRAFCTIAFDPVFAFIAKFATQQNPDSYGTVVKAC